MPLWVWIAVLAAAGFVGRRILTRQEPIVYPPPLTLLREPESEIPLDERVLKLEGGINFRDIGGYRTKDGRTVKCGLVYRSGTLSRLTEADWTQINGLNIKLVCDLRSDDEIAEDPDKLPQMMTYKHLPVNTQNDSFNRLRALFFNKRQIATLLPRTYTELMVDRNPQVMGGVLRFLADADNLPALIHCTAGKDRTGVTFMLLLHVLGVPEETIAADYSLSNLYHEFFFEVAEVALRPIARFGFKVDDLTPLLTADPQTVTTVFDYIREKYGTVERYLADKAGVDAAMIEQLRANLLD